VRLAHNAAGASAAVAAAGHAAVHLSAALNGATATRGDDLPFADAWRNAGIRATKRQRVGLMVGALQRANPQPFSARDMRARVGRSIMTIWLTIAEASRYSGASKERVRTLHDDGSTTQRSGRPLTGRLRRRGDGC